MAKANKKAKANEQPRVHVEGKVSGRRTSFALDQWQALKATGNAEGFRVIQMESQETESDQTDIDNSLGQQEETPD